MLRDLQECSESSGMLRGAQGCSGVLRELRESQRCSGMVRGAQGVSGVLREAQGHPAMLRHAQGSPRILREAQAYSGKLRDAQQCSGSCCCSRSPGQLLCPGTLCCSGKAINDCSCPPPHAWPAPVISVSSAVQPVLCPFCQFLQQGNIWKAE